MPEVLMIEKIMFEFFGLRNAMDSLESFCKDVK